ncbi:hypothetical protein FOCC_FOCC013181 [Frankliniella occidentalis]|nr:hypothetical protein FOCC_FOCC013181 [Frankliniella occidentalis]
MHLTVVMVVVPCPQCNSEFTDIATLNLHIRITHQSCTKYVCKVGNCQRSYNLWGSFSKHLVVFHDVPRHSATETSLVVQNVDKCDLAAESGPSSSTEQTVEAEPPIVEKVDFKEMLLKQQDFFVAKLYANPAFPRNLVDKMVKDLSHYLSSPFFDHLQNVVLSSVSPESPEKKLEIQEMFDMVMNPFAHLNTEYKRFAYFENSGDFIKPVAYDIAFGPFGLLSTIRFEAKHRFLKMTSNVCNSRRNLSKTVALKQQLALCFRSLAMSSPRPSMVVGPVNLVDLRELEDFPAFSLTLPESVFNNPHQNLAKWVEYRGTKYEQRQVLATGADDAGLFKFAEIKLILVLEHRPLFICSPFDTLGYHSAVRGYELQRNTTVALNWFAVEHSKLLDPFPLCLYTMSTGEHLLSVTSYFICHLLKSSGKYRIVKADDGNDMSVVKNDNFPECFVVNLSPPAKHYGIVPRAQPSLISQPTVRGKRPICRSLLTMLT